MQTIVDYGIRYYCYNLHCLVVTAAEGLPNSIGVVCSLGVSMVLVRYSLSKDSYGADNLGRVTIGVRVDSHSPVHRAVLAGNLLMDWLAHLPGHGGALLHLGGHGNTDGDRPAVSDGLVHTGGLWHSPGDGGTLGHWLGVAHGVGDLPGGGPAFGPWNSHTLGNIDTICSPAATTVPAKTTGIPTPEPYPTVPTPQPTPEPKQAKKEKKKEKRNKIPIEEVEETAAVEEVVEASVVPEEVAVVEKVEPTAASPVAAIEEEIEQVPEPVKVVKASPTKQKAKKEKNVPTEANPN